MYCRSFFLSNLQLFDVNICWFQILYISLQKNLFFKNKNKQEMKNLEVLISKEIKDGYLTENGGLLLLEAINNNKKEIIDDLAQQMCCGLNNLTIRFGQIDIILSCSIIEESEEYKQYYSDPYCYETLSDVEYRMDCVDDISLKIDGENVDSWSAFEELYEMIYEIERELA